MELPENRLSGFERYPARAPRRTPKSRLQTPHPPPSRRSLAGRTRGCPGGRFPKFCCECGPHRNTPVAYWGQRTSDSGLARDYTRRVPVRCVRGLEGLAPRRARGCGFADRLRGVRPGCERARKPLYARAYRGFESHSLRQNKDLAARSSAVKPFLAQSGALSFPPQRGGADPWRRSIGAGRAGGFRCGGAGCRLFPRRSASMRTRRAGRRRSRAVWPQAISSIRARPGGRRSGRRWSAISPM